MPPTDRREALTRIFDSARTSGVAYLFALITLGRMTTQELADLSGEERHKVARYLQRLESRGFALRVQSGKWEIWHPTPLALGLFGGKVDSLMVDFLPSPPSSSSDQIRSEASDSDLISEEEEEEMRYKIYLNQKYKLTGPKAEALLSDPWVTPLRLVAWMYQVHQMARDKYPFRKSPEAYAIHCLLRHDEPSRDAEYAAPGLLDEMLRWMPAPEDEAEEDDA